MCGGVCGCCTGALEASYGGAPPAVSPDPFRSSSPTDALDLWDPALLQAPAILGGPTGGVPSVRAYALRSLEGCDPERVRESERTMMIFVLLSFRFDDFFLPRPLTRLETFS
jgi:hypothetical protein